MGVIDLDKRVKKLEQGGGAVGPEIDQLEAAVTSLENTVDGLIEDVTDKFTIAEGVTIVEAESYMKAYRIGSLVFLHAVLQFATGFPEGATRFTAVDIDPSIKPASAMSLVGLGGGGSQMIIQVSTNAYITAGGIAGSNAYANFGAFWTIAEPSANT